MIASYTVLDGALDLDKLYTKTSGNCNHHRLCLSLHDFNLWDEWKEKQLRFTVAREVHGNGSCEVGAPLWPAGVRPDRPCVYRVRRNWSHQGQLFALTSAT